MSVVKAILCVAAFSIALGAPASAQNFGKEKTDAEIALQQADKTAAAGRKARDEARAKCVKKDYVACSALGDHYRMAVGGPQDYGLAAQNYKSACTGGNAAGCASLAYLNNYGRGVKQNLVEARKLYDKSCTLGEVSACAALGNMLYTGTGGKKDVTGGTTLLTKACDQKYQWACERMETLGAYKRNDTTRDRMKSIRGG